MEPFYGGSHRQFMDLLRDKLLAPRGVPTLLITLPPKKWHWNMRTAALHCARALPARQDLPRDLSRLTLLCSSYLNLAELLGLRPDLAPCALLPAHRRRPHKVPVAPGLRQ